MSKSTISTFELFQMFPDEASARIYIEARRWPNGAICTKCHKGDRVTARKDGFYRCNACKWDFTVRTGTIYERSHIPLHKWMYAMYLLMTARKGVSSMQLAKEIGVTQKSAWFMLGRLREACGNDINALRGTIEVDETYIGGREKNKHADKKINVLGGQAGKTAVFGIRERGGRTKAMPVSDTSAASLQGHIREHIELGSTIYSDELGSYLGLQGDFTHETINHSEKEYRRGPVSTNSIESVWAVMKRGLHGVYHKASPKHLHRYVNEFTFRLNDGDVKRHTMDRLGSLTDASFGQRLTYKGLIQ